jgi:hypothetical protein
MLVVCSVLMSCVKECIVCCVSEVSFWTGGLGPECECSPYHTGGQLRKVCVAQCTQYDCWKTVTSGLLIFHVFLNIYVIVY